LRQTKCFCKEGFDGKSCEIDIRTTTTTAKTTTTTTTTTTRTTTTTATTTRATEKYSK
jgi:hypothetical protein